MNRLRALVAVLVAVLITLLWFVLWFSPKRSDLSDAQDQTQAAEAEVLSLRGQLGRLREIEENRVSYESARAELESSVPIVSNLANLLDDLHLLADQTGVDLQSVTPGDPIATLELGVTEIGLVLELEADYFELIGFLFGLEDMERLIRVDSLSIGTQTEGGERVLAVSLTAKAFTTELVVGPIAPEPEDGGGE